MPALLSSCRRAGDEARFDSGEQISCIIQNPGVGGNATRASDIALESDPFGEKKVVFNLSSRPNKRVRTYASLPTSTPLRSGPLRHALRVFAMISQRTYIAAAPRFSERLQES